MSTTADNTRMDINWRIVGNIVGFVVGTAVGIVVFRHHRDAFIDGLLVGGAIGVVGSELAFLVYRNQESLRRTLATFRFSIRELLLAMAFLAAFAAWLGDHLRLSALLDREIKKREHEIKQILDGRAGERGQGH